MTGRRKTSWRLAIAVASGVLLPAAAAAQAPSATGVAEALFQQARADMHRGAFDEACPKLAESERIDPSSGTLLNLAVCEEHQGAVASAWLHTRELLDRLPARDDRRPFAERMLASLAPRVPKLTVRVAPDAPADLHVTLDGVVLNSSSLGIPVPVDPGRHLLGIVVGSGRAHEEEVSVLEGREVEWFAASTTASTDPRSPESPALPAVPHSNKRRPLGWAALGVGAVGIAAGAVLTGLTLDRMATVSRGCPNKHCQDQGSFQAGTEGQAFFIGSMAAFGVGALGTTVGLSLLLQGDGRSAETANGATLTYSGSF